LGQRWVALGCERDSDFEWCVGDARCTWRGTVTREACGTNHSSPIITARLGQIGQWPVGRRLAFPSRSKGAKRPHFPRRKEVTAVKKTLVRFAALATTLTALLAGGGANFKVR